MGAILRTLAFGLKSFVGTILCQTPITSLLVIGWTYRLMQRTALKAWHKESPYSLRDFRDFAEESQRYAAWTTYPNWTLAPKSERSGDVGILRRLFGSLRKNFATGFAGLLTTYAVTLIPCMLWAYSWYAGWNNSFYKAYEEAGVGPVLGLLGIFLFILAMLYVPMAQARHAVTGTWRGFFDYRLVRTVIYTRPVACLFLAAGFTLCSIPVTLFKTAPLLLENFAPETATMTAPELLEFLNAYYFRASMVGFAAFVFLRVTAARIYAKGLRTAVRAGYIADTDLRGLERYAVSDFEFGNRVPPRDIADTRFAVPRPRRAFAVAVLSVAALVWFSFVAQIYVSEFLNYHQLRGWLNQPLVHAPWFRYVPAALEEAARQALR